MVEITLKVNVLDSFQTIKMYEEVKSLFLLAPRGSNLAKVLIYVKLWKAFVNCNANSFYLFFHCFAAICSGLFSDKLSFM